MGAPGANEESAARLMLERCRLRGADQAQCWSGENGILGVCRAAWELGPDFAAGVQVLDQQPLVVTADASLYYRDDLCRALRGAGVRPTGDSPSHLIAAAYEAWGTGLLDVLEGDYAFVLWDRQRHLLLAARDFAGSRPLFLARAGERLILASSLTAVVAHPAVPRVLNRLALAEDLIGVSSMAVRETAFRAVERLPAGARLVWQPGSAPKIERFWDIPRFERGEGPDAAEAAEQLRAVLRAAVRERLASSGPTAVWTSGGYDSPAVFALAHGAARHSGRGPVVPVSMSYPEGDPGREDDLVEAVGRHTGAGIHWVRVGDVPALPDPWQWAGRRDQPFAHPYEAWNRALANGAREVGARVVLGGNGGDQFFSVSPVFLADLARAGRWRELASEARAIGFGRHNLRELFHWAIQPALPTGMMNLARWLRAGRPLKPHLVTPAPEWMGFDRATCDALWQRQWHYGLRRPDESFGSAETSWYLTAVFGQRICSMVMGIVRDAGAEVRSPMYDRRVIEFMARRPREDRHARGETKRLLRQAMSGLLPAEHLAPRPRRTGLPTAYLQRVRREALPRWADAAGQDFRLADLGLARPAAIRTALGRYLGNPRWEGTLGSELFNVFSAEFWLRSHAEPVATSTAMVA
jgi:asparagine synthase (glutamine-hydrolysing)